MKQLFLHFGVIQFLLLFTLFTLSAQDPFITHWVPVDDSITIPTYSNNYNIVWSNSTHPGVGNGSVFGVNGDYTITGLAPGDTYKIVISGNFVSINFSSIGGSTEIVDISQWGDIQWADFYSSFWGCSNLIMTATDVPDLTNAAPMFQTFKGCSSLTTNAAMNNWDVSTISSMEQVFMDAKSFNQDISNWNVSNVTDMSNMFNNATSFNQDISGWVVGSVTDMQGMFYNADAFNQDLNSWNVSSVTNMKAMFRGADAFNGDISNWNVTNVSGMNRMFAVTASFNQDIGNWNVSNVVDMERMFFHALSFDRNLGNWDLNSLTVASNMFNALPADGMSCSNFGTTIKGWALNSNTAMGVTLGTANRNLPPNYDAYLDTLVMNKSWTIEHPVGTCAQSAFITNWIPTDDTIQVPTYGSGYLYDIIWTNLSNPGSGDGSATSITGDISISGLTPGDTYQLEIVGVFPRIYFNNNTGSDEITDIVQWGDINWTSFRAAFQGCNNMVMTAIDAPDLSNVIDMFEAFRDCSSLTTNPAMNGWNMSSVTNIALMFAGATNFNQDISNWDISNVTTIREIFGNATAFNQSIGNWDVSKVTNMQGVFYYASSFNQDINNWNVSNVTNMYAMFFEADAFNQPIGSWNVGNVTTMEFMFYSADSFNQPIGNWNVGTVTTMEQMFQDAVAFNQPIGNWNVSNVSTMRLMFYNAVSFNRNLGEWDLNSLTKAGGMFNAPAGQGMECGNLGLTLKGWSLNPNTPNNITLGTFNRNLPPNFDAYKSDLVLHNNWTFPDPIGTCTQDAFITKWVGAAPGGDISIPNHIGTTYLYDMFYTNLTTGHTGSLLDVSGSFIILADPGDIIVIEITGDYPRMYLNNGGAGNELYDIMQWGDIQWTSFNNAYYGSEHMTMTASDTPDLSNVTDMSHAFRDCSSLTANAAMNDWDVSQVTTMLNMFAGASSFNQDLSSWDVSKVVTMGYMFDGASSFNQDLSSWDVSNVQFMYYMYRDATSFNHDLGNWQLDNLFSASHMLDSCGMDVNKYDATLIGWAAYPNTPNNILLGAENLKYCNGEAARAYLDTVKNWTLNGDAKACIFTEVNITVLLSGPYIGSGMMSTTLNSNNLLPINQPYNIPPWNYNGSEQMLDMRSGRVDWILVRLRDASDYTQIVAAKAGFVLNNGIIRATDGYPISFTVDNSKDYYVEVVHRNHLGIMTATPVEFSYSPTLDFTDTINTPTYGTGAQKEVETGVWAMYAGNVNGNGKMDYFLPSSDRATILNSLGGNEFTQIVNTYSSSDINMDGKVDYFLPSSDRATILNNLGGNEFDNINKQY